MGYFFGKTWLWWLLAIVLAALIAWLLCRWLNRGAGAAASGASSAELAKVQGLADERDARLRRLTADHEALTTAHRMLTEEHGRLAEEHDAATAQLATLQSGAGDTEGLRGELDRLKATTVSLDDHRNRIDELNAQVSALTGQVQAGQSQSAALETAHGRIAELEGQLASRPAPVVPDVASAGRFLGQSVSLDDLTLVEGIGPKISELCHAAGIHTWRELSQTPVARLREILDAAGPRFQIHDPATWPRQAALLADGHWEPFKLWTDALKGGRENE